MKQITYLSRDPHIFLLERREDGLWLFTDYGTYRFEWTPDFEIVFSLRKYEIQKSANHTSLKKII